jgi:hypothetical protein
MEKEIKSTKEEPKSAEHDFYESLAGQPQLYHDDYQNYDGDLEQPSAVPGWAVAAIVTLGLLVILALVLALGIGS